MSPILMGHYSALRICLGDLRPMANLNECLASRDSPAITKASGSVIDQEASSIVGRLMGINAIMELSNRGLFSLLAATLSGEDGCRTKVGDI